MITLTFLPRSFIGKNHSIQLLNHTKNRRIEKHDRKRGRLNDVS